MYNFFKLISSSELIDMIKVLFRYSRKIPVRLLISLIGLILLLPIENISSKFSLSPSNCIEVLSNIIAILGKTFEVNFIITIRYIIGIVFIILGLYETIYKLISQKAQKRKPISPYHYSPSNISCYNDWLEEYENIENDRSNSRKKLSRS